MRHRPPVLRFALLLALILPMACDSATGTGPGDGNGPGAEPANLIGPEGGTITSPDSTLTLEVPAGALDDSVEITAAAVDASGSAPADFVVLDGTGYDLQPDGLTFNEPATLTIRVAGLTLPDGVSLSELRLLQLDGDGLTLPSELDPDAEVVTGSVEHFSSFGVGLATQYTRVACPDLALADTVGMPLDTIALGRLPADFDSLVYVMATAEDTLHSYGRVVVDSATGNAALWVPVHPSADPAGGPVELNVMDGTHACAGEDFTIEALPAAPGEVAAVVDLFQELLDAQAAVLGLTRSDLLNTPVDSMPDPMKPLALVQSMIDEPGNDHALRAIVDGSSSVSGDAHLDLLDPILARTGFRSALSAVVSAARAERAGDRAAADGGTGADFPPRLCTPDLVGTAATLNACMQEAYDAAFEGFGDKALKGLNKELFWAGAVPGLGTAAGIGGAMIWVAQLEDKRNAALLPSLLTRMDLALGQTEFREDEEGDAGWTAHVFATNQGYDMGKEFLEGALTAAGIAGLGEAAQIAGPEIKDFTSWVVTGPIAKALLAGGTIEQFIIDASNFGPVDVTDSPWTQSEIIGDAFSIPEHGFYAPEKEGTATLSVLTNPDKFGRSQIGQHGDMTVIPLYLSIEPNDVTLAPGETRTFTIEVFEADHPHRVAVDEPGSLQGTVGTVTAGDGATSTVEYTAPSSPDPTTTDVLTVEDTATTGARKNATERRLAFATIRFGRLEISPRTPCVNLGDTRTFTADTAGLGGSPIQWEVVSGQGSLSSTTGVTVDYTAPSSGSGEVTLRAYAADHPDIDDQVTFSYGLCTGLAVYHEVTSSVDFPFNPGTCNNVDRDETFTETNLPADSIDPLVPPDPSVVLIGATDHPVHSMDKSGDYGDQLSGGGCGSATFLASNGLDATYTGAATADSVAIDIQTHAASECHDLGSELGIACSHAEATVHTDVRWDLDIDHAVSYDLHVHLTCDAYVQPSLPIPPAITSIYARKEPDGTVVKTDTGVPLMFEACGDGNTVDIVQTLDFNAPSAPDQTDKALLLIQFTNTSPGAIQGVSEIPHEGYVKGFITFRPHQP